MTGATTTPEGRGTRSGGTGAAAVLGDAVDRLVASDPGLNRLRMAVKALVAVSSTLAVEWVFVTVTGQSVLTAVLIGAVVAMMGSMALNDPTLGGKAITAAFIPIAIAVGLLPGTALAAHHTPSLVVFVVVMFAAVFVRRFGPRFFIYGFLGWMGYFFSVMMGGGFAAVPELIEAVAIAAAWALLLSATVLRDRLAATLRRTLEAFWIRGRQVADATLGVLDAPTTRARNRLDRALRRLNETALLVDGHLGTVESGPGDRSRASVRGWVIDAELAVDAIAGIACLVADDVEVTPAARRTLRQMLVVLGAGDVSSTARLASTLHRQDDNPLTRGLLAAVLDLQSTVEHWHTTAVSDEDLEGEDAAPFEPAVALAMGNLPGSAALGASMLEQRTPHHFNPLARLDLVTRQALQVALAAALAIVAGSALDSQRYYWAVIAAFVAFTGTTTVAETTRKAGNRLVGTLLGLGFSILLAEATAGNTTLAFVVILASLFLGFYLQRLSYGAMIFFITIMIGQLYSLLHEFSSGLLVLRLEETAIGAAIGIAVSLLLLPTGTRATARAARVVLLRDLADLLGDLAGRLSESVDGADDLTGRARELDAALRQYLAAIKPLTYPWLFGSDNGTVRYRGALLIRTVSEVRAITRLVAGRPGPDPATAAAAQRLADSVRALAGHGPLQAGAELMAGLQRSHDQLGDLPHSSLSHRLQHLNALLTRLAETVDSPTTDVDAGSTAQRTIRDTVPLGR